MFTEDCSVAKYISFIIIAGREHFGFRCGLQLKSMLMQGGGPIRDYRDTGYCKRVYWDIQRELHNSF